MRTRGLGGPPLNRLPGRQASTLDVYSLRQADDHIFPTSLPMPSECLPYRQHVLTSPRAERSFEKDDHRVSGPSLAPRAKDSTNRHDTRASALTRTAPGTALNPLCKVMLRPLIAAVSSPENVMARGDQQGSPYCHLALEELPDLSSVFLKDALAPPRSQIDLSRISSTRSCSSSARTSRVLPMTCRSSPASP